MATLLLRLEGPLQSWGTTSRFDERDTQLDPSKSGVLGLLCAALGRDRSESIGDLAELKMGVRVDREGVLMKDYQTATGVFLASGKPDRERTVLSSRYFLAQAVFLVGLEGDREFLEKLDAALQKPFWPLALGRKSFVPSASVWIPGGLVQLPLFEALSHHPLLVADPVVGPCRGCVEDSQEGAVRLDQPLAPFAYRRFGPRLVKPVVFFGEADVLVSPVP